MSLLAGLATVAQYTGAVQGIVEFGKSVIESFRGGPVSAPVVAVGGPGFPRAGAVSVGPTSDPFGQARAPIQAGGFGTAAQVVVRRLPQIISGIAGGAAGALAVLPDAPPPLATAEPRTMTQKQFILATAKAFSPGATAKKIIRSARQCGIELAAATFGLDVLQVCFLISQPAIRRSRGISAASVRTTRRTMRQVNALKNLCPPATRRRK